jgi:hypothetical protein
MKDNKYAGDMFYCASCGLTKPLHSLGRIVPDYQVGSSCRCQSCVDGAKAPNLEAVEKAKLEIETGREFKGHGECQKCHSHDELTIVTVGKQEKELCAECAEQWEDLRTYRPKQVEQKRPMLALEDREAFIGECARKLQDAD